MQADIETIRRARRFAADYYRKHKDEWAGTHPSHLANKAITEAGKEFKIGFGCEGFCWNGGREGISYLNTGEAGHKLAGAPLPYPEQFFNGEAVEVGIRKSAELIDHLRKPLKPFGLGWHKLTLPH